MQKDDLEGLIKKYNEGKCSEEEKRIIEKLYDNAYDPSAEKSLNDERSDALYAKISDQLEEVNGKRANSRYRWLAAASILIFTSVGLGLWYNGQTLVQTQKQDLLPGGNKATLTLANGQKIVLANAATGTVAKQGAVTIIKLTDGKLKYTAPGNDHTMVGLNTITTPAGGKYQVVLPDGTNVWLNSKSSISFPAEFSGKERNVSMTGEGYFEVAKNKNMPFKVKSGSNTVEVLGTHFNIMAYIDEAAMKTTLLEGSVKISSSKTSGILKPSQQARINSDNDLSITNTDVEPEIAWKNDLFWFNNSDIHDIMRQIGRWYNVEIKYEGTVTKKFSGTVPKSLSAIKVLKVLEETGGAHFKIENNKITVTP